MAPFTFRDLDAWQQAMELVLRCYRLSENFPKSELFGLTSQIRRAAVSIPSNVAEGHGRRSTKAYVNHVSIAIGSHAELVTCLEICARLGYMRSDSVLELKRQTDSLGRLLYGLHRALKLKLKRNRVQKLVE
jgi:four helix bundle protein